ncbi:MAG TPA: hypothetical protein VJ997_13260 [Longimicrobiales bacterium]|nr:hypothetical protein [Longimicrobiales bacterium]
MRVLQRAAAGAEAGLLAGAGVAVFFLVQDAVQLQPLSTPLALASGFPGAGSTDLDTGLIARVAAFGALGVRLLAYTALHFLAFAAVGLTAAFLLRTSSFWATLWGGVAYASVACTGLFYGGRWIADMPLTPDALGVPTVVLANAMAGVLLGVGLHLAQSEPGDDGTF